MRSEKGQRRSVHFNFRVIFTLEVKVNLLVTSKTEKSTFSLISDERLTTSKILYTRGYLNTTIIFAFICSRVNRDTSEQQVKKCRCRLYILYLLENVARKPHLPGKKICYKQVNLHNSHLVEGESASLIRANS